VIKKRKTHYKLKNKKGQGVLATALEDLTQYLFLVQIQQLNKKSLLLLELPTKTSETAMKNHMILLKRMILMTRKLSFKR
jgi:hypothetical protein